MQQWIIEEISIFSNSSHLEWRAGLSDTIWKGTTQGSFQQSLVEIDWLSSFRGEDFFLNFIPPYFYFKLGSHLGWKSGSPDTILEGAIQGPFHQSLVAIGTVVSEEKIKM